MESWNSQDAGVTTNNNHQSEFAFPEDKLPIIPILSCVGP